MSDAEWVTARCPKCRPPALGEDVTQDDLDALDEIRAVIDRKEWQPVDHHVGREVGA